MDLIFITSCCISEYMAGQTAMRRHFWVHIKYDFSICSILYISHLEKKIVFIVWLASCFYWHKERRGNKNPITKWKWPFFLLKSVYLRKLSSFVRSRKDYVYWTLYLNRWLFGVHFFETYSWTLFDKHLLVTENRGQFHV